MLTSNTHTHSHRLKYAHTHTHTHTHTFLGCPCPRYQRPRARHLPHEPPFQGTVNMHFNTDAQGHNVVPLSMDTHAIYKHIHVRTLAHTHYARIHTYTNCFIPVHLRTHSPSHSHTRHSAHIFRQHRHTHKHSHTYIYTQTHIHTHIYLHTHTHTHLHQARGCQTLRVMLYPSRV
jgi:hypothetical protein